MHIYISLEQSTLKRSDFLKPLAIKKVAKKLFLNTFKEFLKTVQKHTTFRRSRTSLPSEKKKTV